MNGFSLEETGTGEPERPGPDLSAEVSRYFTSLPGERFPNLAAMAGRRGGRIGLLVTVLCPGAPPRVRARLPVAGRALRQARAAVRPAGRVLVVDQRAAGSFTAPGDQAGRSCAAAGAIWCHPPGRAGPGPEPAGALVRPAAMGDLARQAGDADAGIVPAGHRAWRSGRLAR